MNEEEYQKHIKIKIELEIILKYLESKLRTKKNGIPTKAKYRQSIQKS